MAEQEGDSSGSRFDNLVGRFFRPSVPSQHSTADARAQDVLLPDTGLEQTSADQYKYTFGKNRGENTAKSILTSAQVTSPSGEEGDRRQPDDDRTGRRSEDILSPWPARETAETDRVGQTYSTPLTPRMQEKERRAALRRNESESSTISGLRITSPEPLLSQGVGRQGTPERQLAPRRKRSASLGDVFDSISPNSQKGYRQMEKALEAERLQQQINIMPLSTFSATQQITPAFTIVDPSRITSDAMPVTHLNATSNIPRRSSSRGRTRKSSSITKMPITSLQAGPSENRAANVTFRSRAVSAPSTSQDAGLLYTNAPEQQFNEDLQSGRARLAKLRALDPDHEKVYRPAQARPLSLPIVAVPPSSAAAKRASVGTTSIGVSSSMVIPWDPALSTALSLRNAPGISSYDNPQGMSTSNRPSLSLLLQNRARARYHLSALSAMRPRLPAQPWTELATVQYKSWLPLLHYIFLCIITYFHVLATIFFDYNTLYSIVQVAVYPDSPSTSAAWWIAIGIYSAALLLWFIGVVLLWEVIIQYYRRWINPRPFALPIYLSSAAFTLTSIRSYTLYSLLFRVRLSADPRDFFIETFWFYSQNWPTVLTLLPRGIILTVFLVLYSPHSTFTKVPLNGETRDTVYFSSTTGLMKNFSFVILLVNVVWMAWRILFLLISYTGLFFTLGPKAMFEREKTSYDWSDYDDLLTPMPPNVAISRGAARPRAFSSDLPLLSSTIEGRYSSLETQDFLSPDREIATAFESQEQSMLGPVGSGKKNRALNPDIQFPLWAWRARAEDRIKALLFENSATEDMQQNASSSTAWPPFPERGGSSGAALGSAPEMQEVPVTQQSSSQAVTSTPYQSQSARANRDFEMEILSSPSREQYDAEPRSSQSIDATTIRAPFAADAIVAAPAPAPPLSIAIAAIAGEEATQSRSRVSLTPQPAAISHQIRSDRRSRLSSSSELSMYTDPMSRISTDSRFSNFKGQGADRTSQGIGGEDAEMEDLPSNSSGDRTPTFRHKGSMDQSSRVLPPSPLANAILDSAVPTLSRRGRASTSLSSLADSLRFMRSNRSVDKVDSGSSDINRSKEKLVKSDGAWWSTIGKGRFKSSGNGSESTTALPKEEQVEQEVSAQDPEIEQTKGKDQEIQSQEKIDEEQGSIQTHETTSTADSEEKRLWSQFPEQSRRYPPGMIAYEYEQKRLSQEEERRLSSEVARPSNSVLEEEVGEEEEDHSAHSEESHHSEGLRPIKEESWSSSLESASNDSRS